jgi:hypothetical protein
MIYNLPLHVSNFSTVGRAEPPIRSLPMADIANVSPQYFHTIGLRLEAGRFFTDADLAFTEENNSAGTRSTSRRLSGSYPTIVHWAQRTERGRRFSGHI